MSAAPPDTGREETREFATFTRAGVWHGVRITLAYGISAIPFGLAFGAAAASAMLAPQEAVLMSALVFAGAAQFAVLSLWGAPLPLAAIIATAFLVNTRHLVMGAALQPWMAKLPRGRVLLLAGLMTDASWAMTLHNMNAPPTSAVRRDAGVLLGSGLVQWPAWVGGTAIGALLGSGGIDPKVWGLDLLISGFFVAVVIGLYRGKGDILPWLAAVAGTAAALLWLPGHWYFLVGGLSAGIVGLFGRDE